VEVGGKQIKIGGNLLRTARLDAEKYETVENPEPLIEGLRQCGSRVDLFTFLQDLPDREPKFSYPYVWDNLAVLPISTFDQWWTKQVDAKTRNMVRKAEKKGVVLREVPFDETLVRGIWKIYNETPVRQGKAFPHYGKDIDTVRRESATYLDQSIFIGAYSGDELIGFVRLLSNQRRSQTGVLNFVSLVSERDKAPTNALIAQAIRTCVDRGIPYLVYANFAYGKKERDTLSDFKKNNGFQKFDLPRYYVPLTALGAASFRLGLHRRIVDRLPEPLMAKLRELRTAWHSKKAHSAAGVS
jgi:hypothetical protein